jgi:hypothetical protein
VSNASFYGCDDLAAKFFRLETDIKYSIQSKDNADMVDANCIKPSGIVRVELPYRSLKASKRSCKHNASPYAKKPRVPSDTKEGSEKEGRKG